MSRCNKNSPNFLPFAQIRTRTSQVFTKNFVYYPSQKIFQKISPPVFLTTAPPHLPSRNPNPPKSKILMHCRDSACRRPRIVYIGKSTSILQPKRNDTWVVPRRSKCNIHFMRGINPRPPNECDSRTFHIPPPTRSEKLPPRPRHQTKRIKIPLRKWRGRGGS